MKKCTKCNIEKPVDLFSRDKNGKLGYCTWCKLCTSEHRKSNRDNIKKAQVVYNKNNKEKIRSKSKEYYLNNIEDIKKYQSEYRQSNKYKILKLNRDYRTRKLNDDKLFKLRNDIYKSIYNSFINNNNKKSESTINILGCSYNGFLNYLNDNPYNFVYGELDLDIDHIMPISIASTKEEIISLNHYSNFQLLPTYYNRYIKMDNKWNKPHFENWLYGKNI